MHSNNILSILSFVRMIFHHTHNNQILILLCVKIDGFEQEKRVIVIAATNRKQDLDPALIRYVFFIFIFNKSGYLFLCIY